jgi:molybdate transport system substrate-binding protein
MRRATSLLFAALLMTACRNAPREQHLSVFAAVSLTDAFKQLADSLKARHPGLQIDYNFAGSQLLATQISGGARADVFASADDRAMGVVSGLIDGQAQPFAHNKLVLIVPAANPAKIEHLQDIARPKVKLVLADASVPAGNYARKVIANLGQASGSVPNYERRVLANVVSNEENVKGVVTKVELGEADAGFVYVSDVTPQVAKKVMRIEVPDEQNVVAAYPIAVLRQAQSPALAREFVDLILSPAGQQVLTSNGFLAPPI